MCILYVSQIYALEQSIAQKHVYEFYTAICVRKQYYTGICVTTVRRNMCAKNTILHRNLYTYVSAINSDNLKTCWKAENVDSETYNVANLISHLNYFQCIVILFIFPVKSYAIFYNYFSYKILNSVSLQANLTAFLI